MSEDFSGLFAGETDVVNLGAGETLFKRGEPARLMYVVKLGSLQVLDGNYVYETVSAGDIIGEMALVDGGRRSATVRALVPSTVIPVDEPVHGSTDTLLRVARHACAYCTGPSDE